MKWTIRSKSGRGIGYVDSGSRGIYGGCDGLVYQGFVKLDGTVYDDNHNLMGRVSPEGKLYESGTEQHIGHVTPDGSVFDEKDNHIGSVEGDSLIVKSGGALLILALPQARECSKD